MQRIKAERLLRKKTVRELLEEYPDIRYDEGIVDDLIAEMHFEDHRSQLEEYPTLIEFLRSLERVKTQKEFLVHYIIRWREEQSRDMDLAWDGPISRHLH